MGKKETGLIPPAYSDKPHLGPGMLRAGREGGRKTMTRRAARALRPGDRGRLMPGGPTSKENTGGLHGVGRLPKGRSGRK